MTSEGAGSGEFPLGLSTKQQRIKRVCDLALAVPATLLLSPIIAGAALAATVSTRAPGIFRQERVGQYGEMFTVYKIRTMQNSTTFQTCVTSADDPRITPLGRRLRKAKIDELPNLVNVILGNMSLVGPRPDVPGWADNLQGPDRVILTLKPGITGPASLAFRDEERLLLTQADPETYNRETIWPQKVLLNYRYAHNWSLKRDLHIMLSTALGRPLAYQYLSEEEAQ